MNSKDLRIGNYVQTISKLTKIEVESVDVDGINYGWRPDGIVYDFEFKDIISIPLTAEILVKMGFEKKDHINYSLSLMALSLNCRLYSNRAYFEIPNCLYFGEIKSVHQLQNLYFALTGKELTYE